MSCQSISGITIGCNPNTGGVRAIYITNFENVTGTTANGVGTLTDVQLAAGAYFQEFQFNRDSASIEEDGSISLPNGTTFYTQTVTLMIPRREAAKRAKILVLADGQPKLAVIVEDYNGLYWFVGLANGAYLTANKNGSGAKKGDANHYTLTITGEEPELAPEVDSSVISSIIQP